MLRWFGHRAGCPHGRDPTYRGEHALVCAACMSDYVPACAKCGARARVLGVDDGFTHYEFHHLCPSCVAAVRSAGPWTLRRARANEARAQALVARFPSLAVAEVARRRTVLAGEARGRAIRVTLKISARQLESDRYVLRVALRAPREAVSRAELRMDEALVSRLTSGSPSVTTDAHRWLRAGFRHLGKLDIVRALEGLLETAEHLDAER